MTAKLVEINNSLSTFEDFNNAGSFTVSVEGNIATFYAKDNLLVPPSPVELTFYQEAQVLVGDTMGGHFLRGTRNWMASITSENVITLQTSAIDRYVGLGQRVIVGGIMGFRTRGAQNEIWVDYFNNIGRARGALSISNPRFSERDL